MKKESIIKAITIRQPFASAIIYGDKRIENRGWRTKYRGDLIIHAGKAKPSRSDIQYCVRNGFHYDPTTNPLHDCLGAILGIVTLSEVTVGSESKWANPVQYQWVLSNIRKLPRPILCSGKQGLWFPPNSVKLEIQNQLNPKPFDTVQLELPLVI